MQNTMEYSQGKTSGVNLSWKSSKTASKIIEFRNLTGSNPILSKEPDLLKKKKKTLDP